MRSLILFLFAGLFQCGISEQSYIYRFLPSRLIPSFMELNIKTNYSYGTILHMADRFSALRLSVNHNKMKMSLNTSKKLQDCHISHTPDVILSLKMEINLTRTYMEIKYNNCTTKCFLSVKGILSENMHKHGMANSNQTLILIGGRVSSLNQTNFPVVYTDKSNLEACLENFSVNHKLIEFLQVGESIRKRCFFEISTVKISSTTATTSIISGNNLNFIIYGSIISISIAFICAFTIVIVKAEVFRKYPRDHKFAGERDEDSADAYQQLARSQTATVRDSVLFENYECQKPATLYTPVPESLLQHSN